MPTLLNIAIGLKIKMVLKINTIRSDHGGEFENTQFDDLCSKRGYRHEYSALRTPQQNGVVERKNRTLQELARTMLNESKLPTSLWAEVVNTACYVINRVNLRPILLKTPYELWMGRKPNISYFRVDIDSAHSSNRLK
jgi:transposase InsO family protein